MTNRALEKGKQIAKQDYEGKIAEALIGGAGASHKIVSRDSALPPLQLVFHKTVQGNKSYVTDPIEVAKLHTEPWSN